MREVASSPSIDRKKASSPLLARAASGPTTSTADAAAAAATATAASPTSPTTSSPSASPSTAHKQSPAPTSPIVPRSPESKPSDSSPSPTPTDEPAAAAPSKLESLSESQERLSRTKQVALMFQAVPARSSPASPSGGAVGRRAESRQSVTLIKLASEAGRTLDIAKTFGDTIKDVERTGKKWSATEPNVIDTEHARPKSLKRPLAAVKVDEVADLLPVHGTAVVVAHPPALVLDASTASSSAAASTASPDGDATTTTTTTSVHVQHARHRSFRAAPSPPAVTHSASPARSARGAMFVPSNVVQECQQAEAAAVAAAAAAASPNAVEADQLAGDADAEAEAPAERASVTMRRAQLTTLGGGAKSGFKTPLLTPIEEQRRQIPGLGSANGDASPPTSSELADSKDAKKRKLKTIGLVRIHSLVFSLCRV